MIFQEINIRKDVDKSTEINSIYHELSNKQIKDSVVKEVKDDFELSRKKLQILETQLTTRISHLEGMMYNTIIKQTEQLSSELDEKNDILYKFMDSNIFKKFANSFLQKDIVSESSRQPPDVSKNIDRSFLNSPPQCFEYDTSILSKSTSAKISQKENVISIDLNKKINHQLIEIRKSYHQEYISSNCNAVIDDVNAVIDDVNKDTHIDNYDINEKSNSHEVLDSTSPKAKIKPWPRGTCLVTADSMLSSIDETRMLKKFNVKIFF